MAIELNEQIFRIVTEETVGELRSAKQGAVYPFTKRQVYTKGALLPMPDGVPREPLQIVDIHEMNPGDGSEVFFMVFSLLLKDSVPPPPPGQQYTPEMLDRGTITYLPGTQVVRKETMVKGTDMLQFLLEMQKEEEEGGEDDEDEAAPAPVEVTAEVVPAAPPSPVFSPMQVGLRPVSILGQPAAPQQQMVAVDLPPAIAAFASQQGGGNAQGSGQ